MDPLHVCLCFYLHVSFIVPLSSDHFPSSHDRKPIAAEFTCLEVQPQTLPRSNFPNYTGREKLLVLDVHQGLSWWGGVWGAGHLDLV